MLKDGKAYTDENGATDDNLIRDRGFLDLEKAAGWVHGNILPDPDNISDRSSYGLKHLLETDTGLYLTNNEFKDLMMLMGYYPVDANELNWRYHIKLKRDSNDNPSPFFKWAVHKYHEPDSPEKDFVEDMASDGKFPIVAHKPMILWHLDRKGASSGARQAFETLWAEYELDCPRQERSPGAE